jgi:hypothetical protein
VKTDSTRVGEPFYSVVLEPTVAELPTLKLGANEQIVFDMVQQMSGCLQEEIIAACVEKMPKLEGRDKRREYVKRALMGLVSKQAVSMHGERIFQVGDVAAEMANLIDPS